MKTLKERQLEFLEETINYFNSDNRGMDSSGIGCSYEGGCAIGRHLGHSLCIELDRLGDPSISQQEAFNLLPIKLQNLGKDFLTVIQELHDNRDNWNESGLTERGKEAVFNIKILFSL